MALVYQILFPSEAPQPEPFMQQIATEQRPIASVTRESKDQLVVLQNNELLISLVDSVENNSHEFSFGDYNYQFDWYLVLGKNNGLAPMKFYMKLIGRLVNNFSGDFLSLFNGERVVLKREDGKLYLNTESSIWEEPSNLAFLGDNTYTLATYPVNY